MVLWTSWGSRDPLHPTMVRKGRSVELKVGYSSAVVAVLGKCFLLFSLKLPLNLKLNNLISGEVSKDSSSSLGICLPVFRRSVSETDLSIMKSCQVVFSKKCCPQLKTWRVIIIFTDKQFAFRANSGEGRHPRRAP